MACKATPKIPWVLKTHRFTKNYRVLAVFSGSSESSNESGRKQKTFCVLLYMFAICLRNQLHPAVTVPEPPTALAYIYCIYINIYIYIYISVHRTVFACGLWLVACRCCTHTAAVCTYYRYLYKSNPR
jgi:hypothetical protein